MDPKLRSEFELRYMEQWLAQANPVNVAQVLGQLTDEDRVAIGNGIKNRDGQAIARVILRAAKMVAAAKASNFVDSIEAQGHLTFTQAKGFLL